MTNFIIRNYQKTDKATLETITYQTGFKGETLINQNFFNDKRLWFLIFIDYYARYEPEHFFVAVDTNNDNIAGFICGTPDTSAQEKCFTQKMILKILWRAIFVTSWRHPRTFIMFIHLSKIMKGLDDEKILRAIQAEYPAHLHLNLLPQYQRMGLGTRLMEHFEIHLRRHGVTGVHLRTTNYHRKAVPFYKKLGFTMISNIAVSSHPRFNDLTRLTFAKKL